MNMPVEKNDDFVQCQFCEEITSICGLIGDNTNDCPKCGKQVINE